MKKLDFEINAFKAFWQIREMSPIFLDSRFKVKDTGDNTIILFNPRYKLFEKNNMVFIDRDGEIKKIEEDFLSVLNKKVSEEKPLGTGLVFDGGFAGYLSYDFGRKLLGVKSEKRVDEALPGAYFAYYEDFIIIDHKKACTYIITEITELLTWLESCKEDDDILTLDEIKVDKLIPNIEKEVFKNGVERVREFIRQGEVYQVNISQQFKGEGDINPYSLYNKLREANYGPYNAFLDICDSFILSTSPEQLFKKKNKHITTRPIKGTVKKSDLEHENKELKEFLYSSEKNRAELLMIVDLERNDLSRICEPGTVKVVDLFSVEEYATVNHLVATIEGELKGTITFKDIIRAVFPGGSITGAPKLRSVQVIEEIEEVARGIYTGSIGYISNNGNMDFNIAIRTAVVRNGKITYNVGGGITWDSNPEEEYEETLDKGKAIYKVLTE